MSAAPPAVAAYTPAEMMIVVAARALAGATTVFVGVGLPNVACHLARQTVAPDLDLIYESGVYGARPARPPLTVGDPTLVSGALAAIPMAVLFGFYLQRGLVDVALLGGAQVDRFGNLNTTVIGPYHAPQTRLPGSGGACEIAIHARRLLYIMPLSLRGFVGQLDFRTSPGHLTGSGSRAAAGLPGAGPQLVITDQALFNFDNPASEMQLAALYPGVGRGAVEQQVGWPLRVGPTVAELAPPSPAELRGTRALRAARVTRAG